MTYFKPKPIFCTLNSQRRFNICFIGDFKFWLSLVKLVVKFAVCGRLTSKVLYLWAERKITSFPGSQCSVRKYFDIVLCLMKHYVINKTRKETQFMPNLPAALWSIPSIYCEEQERLMMKIKLRVCLVKNRCGQTTYRQSEIFKD